MNSMLRNIIANHYYRKAAKLIHTTEYRECARYLRKANSWMVR